MNQSLRNIFTEVQSYGLRVSRQVQGRSGGAGPAEGMIVVFKDVALNVPVRGPYVNSSPYMIVAKDSQMVLQKDGTDLLDCHLVPDPTFYSYTTHDGIPFKKIALLHGQDCLGSTVLQNCVHWNTPNQCKFCGIGLSLKAGGTIVKKTPEQIAEVAQEAQRLDGVSHIVLTTGSFDPPGPEITYLAKCARNLRESTDLPIHVQFAPPEDLSLMEELHHAGVATVGIHVESFHTDTLAWVAPAKAAIGLKQYYRAWQKAVALFGPNQVSSFLIAGLGEPPESIVWGSEMLADMGVYPFVVPLRPLQGSLMPGTIPPSPQTMYRIYEAVARVLQKKGLSSERSRAGCVRCGACSALSAFEDLDDTLVCHRVRTDEELTEILRIRHEVFVEEQHLFQDTDRDDHDCESIHLVLKHNKDIIGTVRIYPTGNGAWVGSRLAVRKHFRNYRNGRLLIREAMKRVKKQGGTKFTASIQKDNVHFFTKIGWSASGGLQDLYGIPHQLMEADLNRIAKDSLLGN
jgi:radical SAM protein (TIGR04043 family)/putative N-acetyltransferase (TIGR04045 family)